MTAEEPAQVERLRDDLVRVPLRTPTIPPATRTNTYLVRSGERWWGVDPGSPFEDEIARLRAAVAELPGGSSALAGWIITHHHPDHWGGLAAVTSGRPTPVVAFDAERLPLLATADHLAHWSPERFAETSDAVRLIHTPGHSSDHLVLWLRGGDVVAGDLVAGVGSVVINPPDGRMSDYFRSLRHLLAGVSGETLGRLYPAHGPTVQAGAAKLQAYLDHRQQRETQVLGALADATSRGVLWQTPEELVPTIYADVPVALHGYAARSVLAHLLKLLEEGSVAQDDRRWCLPNTPDAA